MGVSDCKVCVGGYEFACVAIRAAVEVEANEAILFALRENALGDRPVVGSHLERDVMLSLRGYYGGWLCAGRQDLDRCLRYSMRL
jgi:hypothetical protein